MVKIGFRVNANFKTGSGHLQRCLALASGLKETDPSCELFFLTSNSTDYAERITAAGYVHADLGAINHVFHDLEATETAIEKHGIDILVTDTYDIDEKYLKALKEKTLLVVIDDFMHLKEYHVHVLVNPNIYAHLLEYKCDEGTVFLLGTEFAQLRSEFDPYQDFKRENPDKARRILVTFGGSDLKGASVLAVKALKPLKERFTATIVAGRAFKNGEQLAREIGLDPRFLVLQDVSDMAKRMSATDLAIASPSTTFYELMLFKTPAVLITQAKNQALIAEYAGKNGLAVSLGDIEAVDVLSLSKILEKLMSDRGERNRMSARIDDLVDGMGRFRLAEEILRIYEEKKQPI